MLTNKLFLISIAILIAATHQDCESIQNPSSIRASSTIFFNNYQTQGQALIKCEGGKCPNACVSTEICSALQGKVANGICYLCQPWQNCVQKINCILPNGYISGNTCVCAAGYYKIAGICLKESAVQHTKISQRGNLNSNGKIIQKINLNYIPDSLTGNNCAVCSQVLVVKVLKCSVSPTLSVVYVPNSKFQFQIEIDFKNQYYIPSISISVQLNPAYKDHFAASDLSQVVPISIDSSNSALSSNLGQLTFGYGSSLLQESRNVYNGIW